MNKGNKVKKSTKQVHVPQDRQIAMDYYNKALDTWLVNHSHVTAHRILCNGMNKRTGFAPRSEGEGMNLLFTLSDSCL